MDQPIPAFFERAFGAVSDGLLAVTNYTRVHLGIAKVSRHMAARARRQVRALEGLARRLILLLALGLTLGPVRPCGNRRPLPEGTIIEPGTAYLFSLLPVASAAFPSEASFTQRGLQDDLVWNIALRRRMGALYRLLKNPQTRALILARHLARQRAAGESTPVVLGLARGERLVIGERALARAFANLAEDLPDRVQAALKTWDSGP